MKKAVETGNGLKVIRDEVFPKGEKIDISHLSYLYYRYPERENVKIPQPMSLFVGDDGHRVVDIFGGEHFMPSGPHGFFHVKYKRKGEGGEEQVLTEKEST